LYDDEVVVILAAVNYWSYKNIILLRAAVLGCGILHGAGIAKLILCAFLLDWNNIGRFC